MECRDCILIVQDEGSVSHLRYPLQTRKWPCVVQGSALVNYVCEHCRKTSTSKIEYYDVAKGIFLPLNAEVEVPVPKNVLHLSISSSPANATLCIEDRKYRDLSSVTICDRRIRVTECPREQHTGGTLWDGAVILAKYLERHAEIITNKTVLELGAGTGYAGIAASYLRPSQVLVTDLAYAIPTIQHNIATNCSESINIKCQELDWLNPGTYVQPTAGGYWDVVLGADIVWVEELIAPLVATLCWVCGPKTLFILCHQLRSRLIDRKLFTALDASGFCVHSLPRENYHPEHYSDKLTIYWIYKRDVTK